MTTDNSRLAQRGLVGCALILAAACSDATPGPKAPIRTRLFAASRTQLAGTVGAAVDEPPSVVVRDSSGHPVAGVVVTFKVTDGGGLISPLFVLSGSDGVTKIDRWTLGVIPGVNTVTARNPTGDSVVFVAVAAAGPPANMRKFFGDGQAGQPGTALLVHPRVRVSDALDNPVSGVAVTFAVEAGGGSVSAASAVTDYAGIAESGDWVLGAAGAQRLVAHAGSLASDPFTARIVAAPAPCVESGTLKPESMTHAQLSSLGCNVYTLEVATTAPYYFTAGSPDFDTNLELRTGDLGELAGNDDMALGRTNSGFEAVLAPGAYKLRVSSSKPGASGGFDVVYNLSSSGIGGCSEAFVVRGIKYRGTAYTGCAPEANNPADRYRIFLESGDKITVDVDDYSYSGPNIRMVMPDGNSLQATAGMNYLTTMTFTAPATGYYVVIVGLVYEIGVQYELRIR